MEQIIMEMHKSVDNGVDIWRLGSDFILSRNETPNLAQHRVRSDDNVSVLGEIVLEHSNSCVEVLEYLFWTLILIQKINVHVLAFFY